MSILTNICRVGLLIGMLSPMASVTAQPILAGAGKIDITPRHAVHLINVKEPLESHDVAQRLYARALAIGDKTPVVLITFDGIGVPASLTSRVAKRLEQAHGIPAARIALCATHSHWAPHLSDLLVNIYGGPLPAEHVRRVDQYTDFLVTQLEEVAAEALRNRRPSRLAWSTGRVTFAVNRRLEEGGQLIRDESRRLMITWNPLGPVDHALPVLTIRDAEDQHLRAVLFSYACHNVALTATKISGFANAIHGDWAGLAQEQLERRGDKVIALCTIGCGGDQRPDFCGDAEVAAAQAGEIADEVDRMLKEAVWQAVRGPIHCKIARSQLPLGPLPSVEELEHLAKAPSETPAVIARAVIARQRLAELRSQSRPPEGVPFAAQAWTFHEGPRLLFLTGEVCIDFQLKLKARWGDRLWPIAYANDTPCYIVSRRMIDRGGYEATNSMFYYGWLRTLLPAAEEAVMQTAARALD